MRLPLPLLGLAAFGLVACGGDEHEPPPAPKKDAGEPCQPGEARLDTGCWPAGLPPDTAACPPGETSLADGGCGPAGVPEDACGEGFAPDGEGGCAAVLARICQKGSMAVPGDAACREVAKCAAGPWGDIPVDGQTQYVDASYAGGDGDGTAEKPWTSIQAGVDAATAGAIVAVAAGSYAENVEVSGSPVRIWGVCPALVEVVGVAAAPEPAVALYPGADGTEVRGIALTGAGRGIAVSGCQGAVVDRVWVHDTGHMGITCSNSLGAASVTVLGSLVEGATSTGMAIFDAELALVASEIRGTNVGAPGTGYGLDAQNDPKTRESATVAVTGSVVRQNWTANVAVLGSEVTLERTVIEDNRAEAEGSGVYVTFREGQRGHATLVSCVVANNQDLGVTADGADVEIRNTTIQDGRTQPTGDGGIGIYARASPGDKQRGSVLIEGSIVRRNVTGAVYAVGSDVSIAASIFRDTDAGAEQSGFGVYVQDSPDLPERGKLALTTSVVERNHTYGVGLLGSDGAIDSTIVRATGPNDAGAEGRGVVASSGVVPDRRSHLDLQSSLIEDNHLIGVSIGSSDATLSATVVRGTESQPSDATAGHGLTCFEGDSGPATVAVHSSFFEDNKEVGILASGCDLSVDATRIRHTKPSDAPQYGGMGAGIQVSAGTRSGGTLSLVSSVIEECAGIGLSVISSSATIDATLIRATTPRTADGKYGDGISILAEAGTRPTATVTASRIEQSARAGISDFGGHLTLGGTTLECNGLDLDGEPLDSPPTFDDAGANVCGCNGATLACAVQSTNLEPPQAI